MPAQVLAGLLSDLRRLLGAGSRSAPGDRSLRQRAGEVGRLSAKVPALRPVADVLRRLTDAAPAHAAGPFLDLLSRMNPVLATLTAAGVPGGLEALPPSGPCSTTVPASNLPRLVRWLRRPDYRDDTKDVRFILMRRADLRLSRLWWWSMHGEKALRAIGNVRSAAVAAVPALEEAARTEYGERRRRAAREALAKVRGRA